MSDKPNQSLTQISAKIRQFEKNTITNVVAIGRLLDEAREQCAHGEYQAWLDREFAWSYRTSLRYFYAASFAEECHTCHGVTFEKLNLSLGALHIVADPRTSEAERQAIVGRALEGRVTTSVAKSIVDDHRRTDPVDDPAPADPIDPVDYDPIDEPPPRPSSDPADTEDDELATALRVIMQYGELNNAWPLAIEAIGPLNFREIVENLKAVQGKYCDNSAVKSAADRAEAKSRMRSRAVNP